MRLDRLTADAAIVLDGAVDASKPVARATPAALTRLPASILATRHFGPGPATEAALPTIR
jgi:hypothetical protein